MRFAVAALAFATLLGGCDPTIPEGELSCAVTAECPPSWACHRDGLCYSEARDEVECVRRPLRAFREPLALPPNALDVLFVVDNSSSLAEEQAALREALPVWLERLSSGDSDGDGERDFAPLRSVQFGVLTGDMGSGGFAASLCPLANGGEDGLLRTIAAGDGCRASYPPFSFFSPTDGTEQIVADLSCLGTVGTAGCSFQQPLEASLKALLPWSSEFTYADGSRSGGHGDRPHMGFVEPDAIFGIVILTDQDDCSAADLELFDETSPTYPGELALRCTQHPGALFPVQRYVSGFQSADRGFDGDLDLNDIVVSLAVGVPEDLALSYDSALDFDILLAQPSMQQVVRPTDPTRLESSCTGPGGDATPPRRLVEFGRELVRDGGHVGVTSVCSTDLSPAFDPIFSRLEGGSVGRCLDDVAVSSAGLVPCDIVEVTGGESCADRGLTFGWREGSGEACLHTQLPHTGAAPTSGTGWYFDDFSLAARTGCPGSGQLAIRGAVFGEGARIECNTIGLPIGRECTVGGTECRSVGRALACDPSSVTCQITCQRDADCAAGFLCDGVTSVDVGVCSNPTCTNDAG